MKLVFLLLAGVCLFSTQSFAALVKVEGVGSAPRIKVKLGFIHMQNSDELKEAIAAARKDVLEDAKKKCAEKGGEPEKSFAKRIKTLQPSKVNDCLFTTEENEKDETITVLQCTLTTQGKCTSPKLDPSVSDHVMAPVREGEADEDVSPAPKAGTIH